MRLADEGLAVFPGAIPSGDSHGHEPGSKSDCQRCKAEKQPVITDWPNKATSDKAIISAHWRPRANIGVGCRKSGLLVIDLDRHNPAADGIDTFTQLCETHREPWPQTFTVPTPGNGLHLYFWAHPGRQLGNSSKKLGPGIDTRGPGSGNGGGYVLGPGSVVGGKAYTIIRDEPIIPLPGWLVELLDPPRPAPTPMAGQTIRVGDKYLRNALGGEVQRIIDCGSQPGSGRNNQLNASAFSLGQLVGAGLLNQVTVETALYAAAEAVHLVHDDGHVQVVKTINSGLTAGMREPRSVRGAR
jgi:hypothetical protein